jgi:hypothetical protein
MLNRFRRYWRNRWVRRRLREAPHRPPQPAQQAGSVALLTTYAPEDLVLPQEWFPHARLTCIRFQADSSPCEWLGATPRVTFKAFDFWGLPRPEARYFAQRQAFDLVVQLDDRPDIWQDKMAVFTMLFPSARRISLSQQASSEVFDCIFALPLGTALEMKHVRQWAPCLESLEV